MLPAGRVSRDWEGFQDSGKIEMLSENKGGAGHCDCGMGMKAFQLRGLACTKVWRLTTTRDRSSDRREAGVCVFISTILSRVERRTFPSCSSWLGAALSPSYLHFVCMYLYMVYKP